MLIPVLKILLWCRDLPFLMFLLKPLIFLLRLSVLCSVVTNLTSEQVNTAAKTTQYWQGKRCTCTISYPSIYLDNLTKNKGLYKSFSFLSNDTTIIPAFSNRLTTSNSPVVKRTTITSWPS